jgi:shikimate kinase
MKNIVLIGMMGSGKTTLGELLAKSLDWPFLDIDAYIEVHYGTIPSLFEKGQDYFRDIEEKAVEYAASQHAHVISTGGGVVLRQRNVDRLKSGGTLFYLDRPVAEILETINADNRPLLKEGTDVLYRLYQERHPKYLSACDYRIDASGDLHTVLLRVTEILKNLGLSIR